MKNGLNAFIDQMVEEAGELAASLGLNRVVGQLYALLYFSPKPLSLDEMTERLKMSKGNTSLNIRELEKWEAVHKIWVKGSRKDYYQANLDIPSVILSRLKIGLTRRLDKTMDSLNRADTDLKEIVKDKKNLKIYQQRLRKIKDWHKLATSLLTHMSAEKIALLKHFI